MLKVGFCGSGAWGITLADLISINGHEVTVWSIEHEVLDSLEKDGKHPRFPDFDVNPNLRYTKNLADFEDVDVIVECVTGKGFRPVCKQIKAAGLVDKPFVITSKGIEQESGMLLVEVAEEIFGETSHLGVMSGPTLANEVMLKHPTSAVAASMREDVVDMIQSLFGSSHFHVYRSNDIRGVALGGAVKNVIAIASGMADGLGFGHNTKALLITRGLVEMKRIATLKGAEEETCNGLSGIGDLMVTGMSNLSRNFSFGLMLGKGFSTQAAKDKIGMVVEGEYTVASIHKLGEKHGVDLPIAEEMYQVIYEGKDPKQALDDILSKDLKSQLEPNGV